MAKFGIAAIAGLGALGALAAVEPAQAFDPSRAPERPDVVVHRVYRPHYVHVYKREDPYKYRYARVGYYPYAGSQYWVPAEQMRYRYRYQYDGPKYRYYPSWGFQPFTYDDCVSACPIRK